MFFFVSSTFLILSCHVFILIVSPFQQGHSKNGCAKSLCMPKQYEDVHLNPDSDCYMLQVTTLNFIFTPVVMGMTLTLVSNSWFLGAKPHKSLLV